MTERTYPPEIEAWMRKLNEEMYPEARETLNEVALGDIEQLIKLDDEIRELKRQEDAIKKRIQAKQDDRKAYESRLLEVWLDAGTSQVKQDGYTIGLRCDRWPKVKEEFKAQAPRAFMLAGLGHMLSVNTMLLRSYALNHIDHNEPLPEEIKDMVEVSEVYSLRTTPSRKRKEEQE